MKNLATNINTLVRQNALFFLLIVVLFASRSSLADWYVVPTGSMQPTIMEGDRILVNKMAYQMELPFTDISLFKTTEPRRGDIVVFKSKAADTRLVKRLIGLPGDTIAMHDNKLTINGQLISYQVASDNNEQSEQLLEVSHKIRLMPAGNPADNFATVTVPDGHYLVLGDNRNNSADSRYIGFVPAAELQGRAFKVLVSLDPQHYYLPRPERTLHTLI